MPPGGTPQVPAASPERRRAPVSGVIVATIVALAAAAALLGLVFVGALKVPGLGRSASDGPYSVIFTESGLPAGTSWSATVHGVTRGSTTTTVTFSEDDGSYAFSTDAAGYGGSPASGTLVVKGATLHVAVKFTKL
jgi:hypothetical protein